MRLAFDERGGVTVVRVQEEKLTYPVLLPFFSEVRRRVEGGARSLLVDLAAVRYVDSASIGCLMDLHQLLLERGGSLRLAGLQPRVENLVKMTGVQKIVPLHPDEDDALRAFSLSAGRGEEARDDGLAVDARPSTADGEAQEGDARRPDRA